MMRMINDPFISVYVHISFVNKIWKSKQINKQTDEIIIKIKNEQLKTTSTM